MEQLSRLANAVSGYPLALKLLSGLVNSGDPSTIERLAGGTIYELSERGLTQPQLVVGAAPTIIIASEALATRLKKQPHDVHSLSSREFEILLAELLRDMGWEVELTKATRDGGKDILAYLNTDVGRLLCLVEAKRYRQDNKVGVELVRGLYGTLCDYQANSAMMVTTSTFSADAQEFQRRHPFQLSLRDCADVVQWITKYKSP